MKWLSIAILVMVVFAFSPAKSAEATDFSFSVGFHDELSPYGTWVNFSNYGNVWRPYGYSGWRPYTDGYWGYTSYGPTWYGNEPYAPYVYHYGNWIYTAQYGWIWIPGYDYHPGRVNWSYGGGYIGWRPQFPNGYYYPGSDYNFWVVIDADRFGYNSYRPYALRSTVVRDLFARRVFRTRYNTFRRAELERIVRRPVRVLNVREHEVRIGDRRARLLATSNDEARIRKHVTQVRGVRDIDRRDMDRRRAVERDTVMKRKFDDIKTKSSSKVIRKSDDLRKPSHSNKKFEKSSKTTKKVYSKPKVEKKSRETSKSNFSRGRFDNERGAVKRASSVRKSDTVRRGSVSSRKPSKVERASNVRKSDTVRKASASSRKPSKVERVSHVRKSEVKSHQGKKAEVSKAKRTTTKKETEKKQKPRRHH